MSDAVEVHECHDSVVAPSYEQGIMMTIPLRIVRELALSGRVMIGTNVEELHHACVAAMTMAEGADR